MIALFLVSVLASWAGAVLVRRYAVANDVIDVPNARSSHAAATPTGGGLSIAATVVAGIAIAAAQNWIPHRLALAIGGGGAAVAGIGWLDDRIGLRARTRLAVHFGAAAWALYWIGGLPAVRLGESTLGFGPFGAALAAIGIVWSINLYNFMDGIDGLAAGEAITAGLFGALIAWSVGAPGLAVVALLVAAANGGFLALNWAPARIFMGDVGSGMLGFIFGVIAVASEPTAMPLMAWVILLGVFVFDATVTLLRRVSRRHKIYDGHRHHAYQRAVRAGSSHRAVTSRILVLNVALGGLAWLGTWRPALMPAALFTALALLAIVFVVVERRYPMRDE